jgi:hypothetical protein
MDTTSNIVGELARYVTSTTRFWGNRLDEVYRCDCTPSPHALRRGSTFVFRRAERAGQGNDVATITEVSQRYALSWICLCCLCPHALQIFHSPGRTMHRLNSAKQTKASLTSLREYPTQNRNQKHSPLLHLSKTGDHQVLWIFCSSWSLGVVVHRCRVTLLSLSSFPRYRLRFVPIFHSLIYYSITMTLPLHRFYFTQIPASPLARSSPHFGPPLMDMLSVPSIVRPNLPRSLPPYLSA